MRGEATGQRGGSSRTQSPPLTSALGLSLTCPLKTLRPLFFQKKQRQVPWLDWSPFLFPHHTHLPQLPKIHREEPRERGASRQRAPGGVAADCHTDQRPGPTPPNSGLWPFAHAVPPPVLPLVTGPPQTSPPLRSLPRDAGRTSSHFRQTVNPRVAGKVLPTHCVQVLVAWTGGALNAVQGLLGIPAMLPGGPRGQNRFYSKTKTVFAFFMPSPDWGGRLGQEPRAGARVRIRPCSLKPDTHSNKTRQQCKTTPPFPLPTFCSENTVIFHKSVPHILI